MSGSEISKRRRESGISDMSAVRGGMGAHHENRIEHDGSAERRRRSGLAAAAARSGKAVRGRQFGARMLV